MASAEEGAPPREGWLEESGFEGVFEAASWGVVVAVVVVVVGVAEAVAGTELKAVGRSCCCVWRCW